jgi:hypothetical protein
MKLISNKSFDTLLDVERFLDQINDGDSFQFSKDSINKRLGAMHDGIKGVRYCLDDQAQI